VNANLDWTDELPPILFDSFNSSFNYASESEGGLYVGNQSSLFVQFCRLESNRETNALVLLKNDVPGTVRFLSVMNNTCKIVTTTAENGALVYVEDNYTVTDSVFANNQACLIVGFGAPDATLTLQDCTFDFPQVRATGSSGQITTSSCALLEGADLPIYCLTPTSVFSRSVLMRGRLLLTFKWRTSFE
jgi:hypothetical protein